MFNVTEKSEGTGKYRRLICLVKNSGVGKSISRGEGGLFIYSCSALLNYFEIDCF